MRTTTGDPNWHLCVVVRLSPRLPARPACERRSASSARDSETGETPANRNCNISSLMFLMFSSPRANSEWPTAPPAGSVPVFS